MLSGLSELPPETRLLLACCHVTLNLEQQAYLRRLTGEIGDWAGLVRQTRHHFIVPLVYQNLSRYASDSVPAEILTALKQLYLAAVARNLQISAELRSLVQDFLEPDGIPYLPFKGVTLAERYYGGIELRQTRDIDVLVESRTLLEVARRLLRGGYRLVEGNIVTNDNELRDYCRYTAEVNFVSPRGVVIELHQTLDFNACQLPFETSELLERSDRVSISGVNYPVFSTEDLFLFICYHHSRHQWSRLHWVADLSAFLNNPSFDLEQIRRTARSLGLGKLLESTLTLYAVLLKGEPLESAGELAKRRIAGCLNHLSPDTYSPVIESREKTAMGIWKERLERFRSHGAANVRLANRLCYLKSTFRPSYPDCLFLPLPDSLHFLYPAIRPIRWAYETIRGKKVSTPRH